MKMDSAKEEDHVESISMVEVLEEQAKLEEDATAVLGAGDDKQCTYIQGYLPRQAIYACITCATVDSAPAGLCLACSLDCHDGHELYELYTKRNFKCDCGNSKFVDCKCKLFPTKLPINDENSYNHNFKGLYCTCERPYPDPEDEIEDEMIQCIVCEDWYHGRHLGASVPEADAYEEMVCAGCSQRCHFLRSYRHLQAYGDTSEPVDVCSDVGEEPGAAPLATHSNKADVRTTQKVAPAPGEASGSNAKESGDATEHSGGEDEPLLAAGSGRAEVLTNTVEAVKNMAAVVKETAEAAQTMAESVTKTSEAITNAAADVIQNAEATKTIADTVMKDAEAVLKKVESPGGSAEAGSSSDLASDRVSEPRSDCCLLQSAERRRGAAPSSAAATSTGASFWKHGWREKICRCDSCKTLYTSLAVPFILDLNDPITAYEQQGRERQAAQGSQYDRGMEALASMGQVQQVEMMHGFNDLKTELKDYLKRFAENGKVVREEDIREFFTEMAGRKRQKVGVQHFCR